MWVSGCFYLMEYANLCVCVCVSLCVCVCVCEVCMCILSFSSLKSLSASEKALFSTADWQSLRSLSAFKSGSIVFWEGDMRAQLDILYVSRGFVLNTKRMGGAPTYKTLSASSSLGLERAPGNCWFVQEVLCSRCKLMTLFVFITSDQRWGKHKADILEGGMPPSLGDTGRLLSLSPWSVR